MVETSRVTLLQTRNFSCYALLLCCSVALNSAIAGGSIFDPVNDDDLEEGWSIQPSGDIDPIHFENEEAVTVTVIFHKQGATSGGITLTADVEGDWWAPSALDIPGGDYVGGKWFVILTIGGTVAATHGGDIIASDE